MINFCKAVFLAIGFSSGSLYADSYDALLRRYERQIHSQERQLRVLRTNLLEKERDAREWQRKAKEAKSAWERGKTSVQKASEKVRHFREQWSKTHLLAETAQWSVVEKSLVGQAANDQMARLVTEWYKRRMTPRVLAGVATGESMRQMIMEKLVVLSQSAHQQADHARQEEIILRDQEIQWQNREQRHAQALERLRHHQHSYWIQWQEACQRRARLEEEKNQLEQSAQALRVMLQELREHRDQTLAFKSGSSATSPVLAIPKGSLSWPLEGQVIQSFGRQYSSEINQLLVSNGIKIQAEAGRSVRTIQAGKVLFARPFQHYGQLVIVQHKEGLASVYAGLGQTRVKEGDLLNALDPVGSLGDGGSFYFELRHHEEPINPLVWLAPLHTSDLSLRRKSP